MNHKFVVGLCLIVVLAFSISISAHHGTNISYDHSRTLVLKGIVTEFRYSNPHCQIYFDVKDEKGDIQHWAGELTSPYNLAQAGWSRRRSEKELQPGTELTISVWPSKASTTAGVVTKITNSKGEQILSGRAE
ncbi:MAG TPA: DUF6152 family protein [Terriglobia bacterium]|nr:DUF6152 family protein [Terriglobia bacterium]